MQDPPFGATFGFMVLISWTVQNRGICAYRRRWPGHCPDGGSAGTAQLAEGGLYVRCGRACDVAVL